MGANESNNKSIPQTFQQNLQKNYHVVRKGHDSRFGNVELFKDNSSENYILLKEKWIQSEEEYENYL